MRSAKLRALLAALVFCLCAASVWAADVLGVARNAAGYAPAYYAGSTASFTPAATATDIFTVSGSASKTVRLRRIILSGTQTTAGTIGTISVIKRSAADTGGTAVATTRVPLDSTSAAATSTVQHFTANPTALGAAVGTIFAPRVLLPAPATAVTEWQHAAVLDWDLSHDAMNVTLRGVAEALAVNMGGGALPTGAASFHVDVLWTEE